MKVYAKSEEVRTALNQRTPSHIVFTDDITQSEIVVSGQIKKEDIHDKIKALVIPYVGYNQVDQQLLIDHHIALFNTQVNGVFVAERALGLCLALMGKIALDHGNLKQQIWSSYEPPSEWESIRGKRVGFLGYGVIGRAIHEMLKPFNIHAYTLDRKKEYQDISLVDNLEDLVDHINVLFVQVPLTHQTEGMINKSILARMKGKYLINVGRGKVIEEKALYQAIKDKVLKGYASDVWYEYPKKRTEKHAPSKYPICDFDSVVCTSHSAGNVLGIDELTYDDVAKRIINISNNNYEGQIELRKEDKK